MEKKSDRLENILRSDSIPYISIIIPVKNLSGSISFIIRSALSLSYRRKKLIIVNDGSTDNTMDVLKANFRLVPIPPHTRPELKTNPIKQYYRSLEFPQLIVVDKEPGGKADALNAGINTSDSPFFIILDGDTIINDMTLASLVRLSLIRPHVVACGGTIGVGNDCVFKSYKLDKIFFPRKFLPGVQAIEYNRAFLFGRLSWNSLGGNLILSGAFGLFDRKIAIKCGGYQLNIGDDVDMVINLHRKMHEKRKPYIIDFYPDLVGWTEVPTDWGSLFRQRERWHRALLNSVWKNKKCLFNPKYGVFGMVGFPLLVLIEGISPIIESGGYILVTICYAFDIVNLEFAIWFLVVALLFPMLLSLVCLAMEILSFRNYQPKNTLFRMLRYSILEQLGTRQILVYVRAYAFFRWLRGVETWGKLERAGVRKKEGK